MGNKTGARLDYRQESSDEIMDRAKAEYVFSERLYEIILSYQNRDNVKPGRRKPLKESERVRALSLDLSRLYNKIWSAALELEKGKSKKIKQQMEVIA